MNLEKNFTKNAEKIVSFLKKNNIKTKKIEKYLSEMEKSFLISLKGEVSEEELVGNELKNISSKKKMFYDFDLFSLDMKIQKNGSFIMIFDFNKSISAKIMSKKNIKEATLLGELIDNQLTIELEVFDKNGERNNFEYFVSFTAKELKKLSNEILIKNKKGVISLVVKDSCEK